jgi:hypothetical protein
MKARILFALLFGVLIHVPGRWDAAERQTYSPPALLGEGTPDPIPLWRDKPPRFLDYAPPETVEEHARIRSVSVLKYHESPLCLPAPPLRVSLSPLRL